MSSGTGGPTGTNLTRRCCSRQRSAGGSRSGSRGGGGALYGQVVYVDRPFKLISAGPSSLNKGTQSYNVETLEAVDGGTIYRKELHLWGDVPAEVEQMFTEGVKALMERALKGYLEEGIRYSAEGAR